MDILLTDDEVRVLGCLMEKEMATPDYYPLTLNALTNACNQKSNRDPVVAYDEETVVYALNGLRERKLDQAKQRQPVPKYEQIFSQELKLVPGNRQSSAFFCYAGRKQSEKSAAVPTACILFPALTRSRKP